MDIKKILFTLVFLGVSFISNSQNSDVVLQQGKTSLTLDDIDGFALSIPKKDRAGFFHSSERIGNTLSTLLNMKHIQDYLDKNQIIDKSEVYEKVNFDLLNKYPRDASNQSTLEEELNFEKLKKYLYLKYNYKKMQEYIVNLVKNKDVIELAQEQFQLNKLNYTNAKRMNIEYFSLPYNSTNKGLQIERAKKLKVRYTQLNHDLEKLKDEIGNTNIEYVFKLNNFTYNNKYPEFSKFVFNQTHSGVVDGFLDANSRIMVINIKKIIPESTMKFDEVKESLLTKLKKEKAERDFGSLISQLTTEEVEINKDLLQSLQNRY